MGTNKTLEMKNSSLALLFICAFTLFACQKEVNVYVPAESDDAISFIVNEAKPYATKSLSDLPSQSFSDVIFSNDSVNIFLTVNESDYHSDFFNKTLIETKGAPYIDDNIGNFNVSAFFSDMQPFFSNLQLNSTDGSAVSTGYYWPLTTPATKLNFFGHAKNGSEGAISSHNYVSTASASFRYTLPTGTQTSAVNQPDMIFAISPDQVQTGNPVQMDFYHALSALAFSVGSVPGNLKIEKVEFTNIYSSGTCTYTHQEEGLSFDWSFDSEDVQKEYIQTFAKNLFSDGNVPLTDGTAINTDEQTFMMIPQEIDDESKIIFTISFHDRIYTIERSLKKMAQAWLPGKLYTFKISSPEEIEVEVTDEVVMDGIYPVKRNLQIKNIGIADAYIRVAIAGSWVVDNTANGTTSQLIISDWKPSDGEFTWPAAEPVIGQTNANHWRLGSDGYYYYMKKTSPGEALAPLFTSYKLTANSPMSGAYLELSILTQGVLVEQTQELFPADIFQLLNADN